MSEGVKADRDKGRWDLMPWKAAEDLVDVLTFGAGKYAPDDWRHVPDLERRYLAAGMRHIVAHQRGERLDPESNLPHLAHAIACLMFILEVEE